MKTAEEQLIEVRVAYIKNLYQGQPEDVINKAVRNVHRMNFDSVEDFESFAKDQFQNDPSRQATDDEVNAVLDHMGLDGMSLKNLSKDTRSKEDKMIDDIMSHM